MFLAGEYFVLKVITSKTIKFDGNDGWTFDSVGGTLIGIGDLLIQLDQIL